MKRIQMNSKRIPKIAKITANFRSHLKPDMPGFQNNRKFAVNLK